jgi:nucleoside-diphosphate-sugar epimerase
LLKNVIITGASGMVGKAVLLECLDDDRIGEVLLINRKPLGYDHSKVKELVFSDFMNFSTAKIEGVYDACFFCMGVSVVGLSEEKYKSIIVDVTKVFVDQLHAFNSNMVFNYVSGEGTDSSEKGKTMWARVKGAAENLVFSKEFKDAYAFRPGMILPERGIVSNTRLYNWAYILTRPLFPFFRKMKNVTTTTSFGKAMINSLFHSKMGKILHNPDINKLANTELKQELV